MRACALLKVPGTPGEYIMTLSEVFAGAPYLGLLGASGIHHDTFRVFAGPGDQIMVLLRFTEGLGNIS